MESEYIPVYNTSMKTLRFLVIEDDKYFRLTLNEILRDFGIIEEANTAQEAISKLANNVYDVVLTDIELGSDNGVDLIPLIRKNHEHCLVISSYESDDIIEKAYERGARHYLSKNHLKAELPVYIQKVLQQKNSHFQNFLRDEFLTQDESLIEDLKRLSGINLKNQTLAITGPTGTGKSLLGKLVHEMTHGEKSPFVHLNCSEVPENLLESELFGHEKGSFTGADQKKDGKLKLAHGGTLFLDEVGTMPMSMQQKLLKAIDEKSFYPVGSNTPVKAEFTLISATCEDLHKKIDDGVFREDLYYRLSGFSFYLKPLSERSQDIELLIRKFQKKSLRRFIIKPEAMEILKSHPWSGNIRELKKVCEQLSQEASGIIESSIINRVLGVKNRSQKPAVKSDNLISNEIKEYIYQNGIRTFMGDIEKEMAQDTLKKNQGKITLCIKDLKISSSAFYRILQEHRLSL